MWKLNLYDVMKQYGKTIKAADSLVNSYDDVSLCRAYENWYNAKQNHKV